MANIEEEIKAFLSDEKKVEAIASDQKFLEAVSCGKITTEVIVEKFRELGLLLSDNEAKEVKDATEKALAISPEKLESAELQKISGGASKESIINYGMKIGAIAGLTTGIGGLGCWFAKMTCELEAEKEARRHGYNAKTKQLLETAERLNIASHALTGLSVPAMMVTTAFAFQKTKSPQNTSE